MIEAEKIIAAMSATLEFLSKRYSELPVKTAQFQRAAAMDLGRAVMADESVSREDFLRAYDLVILLDRVGY